MVPDLGKIQSKRLSGTERFNVDGLEETGTVGAFWQWSASDLLGNTSCGVLAEYLVALALGVDVSGTRDEWAACDLRTHDGVTVRVKSAAYLQGWHQECSSKIVFDVKPRRAWSQDSNKLEDESKRHSQVYVFALLQHKDKATVNPLDVTQWWFFVLPRSVLDARTRSQHSITDSALEDLAGDGVPFARIKEAVRRAAELPSPPVTAIPPTRRRMNRTTLYKIQYVAAFLAVLGTAIALTLWLEAGFIGAVAVAAVLMFPGRVQGVLWRDLFRGRALLDRGHPGEAIGYLRSFLDTLERQPWRRRLWWLSWAIYSRDPVAMALNNIGAAQLRLDRLAEAEVSLRTALREDPQYPVPYVNLGYAALARSEEDESAQHFATAARLGYTRSATDRLVVASSALLAQIEGRGGTTKALGMHPTVTAHLILYVADQARAAGFYSTALGIQPRLDVPGMTEFELPGGAVFGLMPEAGIRKLLGPTLPDPATARGTPRAELYLIVDDPALHLSLALDAGATLLSPLMPRGWGHHAAYCLDLDAHVLAFARDRSAG